MPLCNQAVTLHASKLWYDRHKEQLCTGMGYSKPWGEGRGHLAEFTKVNPSSAASAVATHL